MNLSVEGLGILIPVAAACGLGVLVLLAEMFASAKRLVAVAWLAILGLVAVAWSGHAAMAAGISGSFQGVLALDGYSVFFGFLLCALAVVAILMSVDYLPEADVHAGEYYPLVVFAVAGMLTMAAATDLVIFFLGLEIMSMAAYVLAGIRKHDRRSNEAALKYFLLGAFASAFLLYGIAVLYGQTGSTSFAGIAGAVDAAGGDGRMTLLLGVGLVLVGLGFKVGAVPFHLWVPDVYEGSPTSVTVFMATAVKAAGFAAFVKIVVVAMHAFGAQLGDILWAASALTMTVGNLAALRQTSLKRMLAYSSVAHTGYLLMGLAAGTAPAAAAVLFYLAAYGAMNLGAFGVMMMLARRGDQAEDISDFAGLGRTRPMLALAMTVCMLSLTGIPPLAGFAAKFYLFAAVLQAGRPVLVLVAVLNSVLAATYYIGVVRSMYFDEGGLVPVGVRPHLAVGVGIAVIATIVLGVAPSGLLEAASWAFDNVALLP